MTNGRLYLAAKSFHDTYCPVCPEPMCALGLALRDAVEPSPPPDVQHDYGGSQFWAYKEGCQCGQCRYARKLLDQAAGRTPIPSPSECCGLVGCAISWPHFHNIDGPYVKSGAPQCWCHKCQPDGVLTKMILCPDCGNKRCPKASDHELACTRSNEPGQAGSVYA